MTARKPILLLQSRPEVEASDDEFRSFCKFGGLDADEIVRVQMHLHQPDLNLDDYAAVLMGGGPANFAYDDEQKSAMQRQFEPWLLALMQRIIAEDKPFLGACLGVGAIIVASGGQMSLEHGEPIGAVRVVLTDSGRADPIMATLSADFDAFVGHKEGVVAHAVPSTVSALAHSKTGIQMIRAGANVYGTQFHPELDAESLALRIKIYRHAGYFEAHEVDDLIAAAWRAQVTEPVKVLQAFVERYYHAHAIH